MASSEIGTNVIFKKQLGLHYEIDQKYVGLKMKENNILSFNFRVPGELKDEVVAYFKRFKLGEPIMVDIGGTGDTTVSFRGIIDGKGKNLPQNLDHKIILLQEPTCLDPRVNVQKTGFSKFRLRN